MKLPHWYELVLLALAAWRVFQLVAEDTILDRPRRYVTDRTGEKLELFIECPYCAGFWIFVGWWTVWQITSHALLVASLFAGHALLIGADKVLSSEE